MNDSRVDRVAQFIRDAQAEKDISTKLRIVQDAADEWSGFADEFPATDVVIAVVTRRLETAVHQLAAGLGGVAGLSLQVASNAVRAVQQR